MSPSPDRLSTGLSALDEVLQGLRAGDNVVWQVETIEDYVPLVTPFVTKSLAERRKVVYFRFARHAPLVPIGLGVEIHTLNPAVGFESFTASIHRVIEGAGRGAYYVFDCLSDLAVDWYSDLMLGNFFQVTCPYLYQLDTVAYFALIRDAHAYGAIEAIRSTTQLLVDVFRHREAVYVQPLKVHGRQSPTMYLPHAWCDQEFRPLTESAVVAEALTETSAQRVAPLSRLDVSERRFQEASEVLEAVRAGRRPRQDERDAFRSLVRLMFTRDERFVELATRYLEPEDLFAIRRRMIGTGLIGGKAAGMLLARAMLVRSDPEWRRRLEPHDSWFIGSDVFYTYLVKNGLWRTRHEQRDPTVFLAGAAEARRRILEGTFPDFAIRQLVTMLESYGQSPIIVRSSSLLEDGFGNAFSGKYESVFCPNQGAPEERMEGLLAAIKTVYASAMSEEALRYREDRGLLDRDEHMAVLVQRVSGAVRGKYFYPQVAGVALSYNPFVWNSAIDPEAGMVRLVFGMGTRAVERVDDDYTRIVALNSPHLRPGRTADELRGYSQRRVDVIDLEANQFRAAGIDEVVRGSPDLPVELFAVDSPEDGGWELTFEELLGHTPFVGAMRSMLAILRDRYRYPVDVEFTANQLPGGEMKINLVQCRSFQVKEGGIIVAPPANLPEEAVLLSSRGPVIGQSTIAPVDRLVYVDPDVYDTLRLQDRYEVARVVGRLTRLEGERSKRVLLLGPGRWATTTPTLGVPVIFPEIQRVSTICEIMGMGKTIPDVSLGSHFFNDLVEANMLYLVLYPDRPGHRVDTERLRAAPNRLPELLPADVRMASVVRAIDFPLPGDGRVLWLNANCVKQEVLCYLAPK